MTMNQTATNADWLPSHLRFCNFTVCLQGLGDGADSFTEGNPAIATTWTAGLHLLAQLPTSESCVFFNCFYSRWMKYIEVHEVQFVLLLNPQTTLILSWKIQTIAFDGLNNCKCDKRLKRRCYGATFIQDMEKEGHQSNQRHNNCHSDAATRPRFKFSIRVVFSFSSWVIRFCSKAWTEA